MEQENSKVESQAPTPIIHIPDAIAENDDDTNPDDAIATDLFKIKFTKSDVKPEPLILNPNNFNLCRPTRSKEIINGLQYLYSELKQRKKEEKESAKLLLAFMKKKRQQMRELKKLEDLESLVDAKAVIPDIKKQPERFGAVRNSIELTGRSYKVNGYSYYLFSKGDNFLKREVSLPGNCRVSFLLSESHSE